MDGGAYCTLSPVVASRGVLHAGGAYRWPACRIDCRVVATNTPPNGAFRGFGVPQTVFAIEAHIERIAHELGLDPLEVRRKNALELGDTTPTGQELRWSVAAHEVLDAAVARSDWHGKRHRHAAQRQGSKRRGIGLSLALHGAGFTGAGEVKLKARAGVELTPKGCRVLAISTDIGQGTETIFA
jgi:CO/xanthine dehydrogenase Mo-binding subunit